LPCAASAIAILTDVVDLPTPPFPELTIKKFFTCGAIFFPRDELYLGSVGAITLQATLDAPIAFSSVIASSLICSATSGALDVISTSKLTSLPLVTIFFTNPKVTISLVKPGYKTLQSADLTISSVIYFSFNLYSELYHI